MVKKRIYISGNAGGSSVRTAQMFFEAEQRLKENPNYEVFNSYELGFTGKLENEDAKDWFDLILSCDAIYLLHGWLNSAHSISERDIMEKMGKAIIYDKKSPIHNAFEKTNKLRSLIHEFTGCNFDSIITQGRERERYYPRILFCYYCHAYLDINKTTIAKLVKRHFTSVIHALNQYESLNEFCPEFKEINNRLALAYFKQ